MKVFRLDLLLVAPVVLAVLAGPVALIASQTNEPAGDIYLLVTRDPAIAGHRLESFGVRALGPETAAFGLFVTAEDEAVQAASDAGYWLIPAAKLAAICGWNSPLKDAT